MLMHAKVACSSVIVAALALIAPSSAAATTTASPSQNGPLSTARIADPSQETKASMFEPRVPPVVGWLVVVAVRGGVQAIKVGVRARTAKAAREAAKAIARDAGYEVLSTESPIKGDYKTAGGFQILLNQDPRRGDGYASFNAFKNAWGAAGENREWHHIVEQKARNSSGNSFPSWQINNKQNLINIRKGLHQKCINSLMATRLKNLIPRDRQALRIRVVAANREHTLRFTQRGYSYNNQHLFGLRLLKHCGVTISGAGI